MFDLSVRKCAKKRRSLQYLLLTFSYITGTLEAIEQKLHQEWKQ